MHTACLKPLKVSCALFKVLPLTYWHISSQVMLMLIVVKTFLVGNPCNHYTSIMPYAAIHIHITDAGINQWTSCQLGI